MEGVGVGFGVDGDGADAEGLAGADDAAGDLAAVGDEDLGEHVREDPFVSGEGPVRRLAR
ncbi:hypothetical protein D3C72_2555160 [compost metagenome]